MAIQFFSAQAVDDVGQPVGLLIQVRRVDLTDVAGEDDFGVLACTGDDGLDLMWCEVLGLVDDENHVGQRAAADVGQRGNLNLALRLHVLDGPCLALVGAKLVLDEVQVVEQRLHVGVDLLLRIAWQKAQIFVAQRHNGAGEDDLVVAVLLFEGACKCEKGFPRSRHPANGHEVDVGVLNGMQGKGLLGIARLDAVRVRLVDPFDVALLLVEEAHGTGRAVLQDVEVVVLAVVAQCRDFSAVAIDIHLADDIAVHAFKGGAAGEHVPVVLDLACLVILGGKVQRLGLEAQVDVFRHKDDLGLRLFGLQAKRSVQNLVVVGAL